MPRVLVFRHVASEHLGLIAPSLESRGIQFDYVDLWAGSPSTLRLDGIDGLVSMGGPMSANDDLPCLRQEMALIGQAAAAGKPVLGVCLGSQLVAKAFGARVYHNPVREIGWYPVWWTGAAQRDPLLAGLAGPETVFHWHGETFDLPPGAVWLARSEACRHQAFRVGSNTYGFQFHLEVTPEMIADWIAVDGNAADVRELAPPPDPDFNVGRLAELSEQVFGRWAGLVVGDAA